METLIIPSRFDLMAKYLYVKQYDKKYNTTFFFNLYRAHIITFNGGRERPDRSKNETSNSKSSINDFIESFNNLIEDIKTNGYNKSFPIPISSGGIIENGSHRLMTSYYYNIKPEINIFTGNGQQYNYNFFLNRKQLPPLARIYSDEMALEYTNHNSNLRCMILYPKAYNIQKITQLFQIINTYGYIYYHKEINLTKNGLLNLIKELYRGEEWIGGLFPSNGANSKLSLCYYNNPTIYISIVMKDVSKLIEMKEKCRSIFNLGKHSLHVSDYIIDTRRISCALLNKNSIHFLNNGTNNISNKSKILLNDYFNSVKDNKEDFCLTSSIIMEMYGIRHANDIDYIQKDNLLFNKRNIGIHDDKWLKYYHIHKDDIIFNPNNYFYFNNYKFATIDVIKKMKEKRNEPKDINDIILIQNLKEY